MKVNYYWSSEFGDNDLVFFTEVLFALNKSTAYSLFLMDSQIFTRKISIKWNGKRDFSSEHF